MAVIDSEETFQKWMRAGKVGQDALAVGKELCTVGTPLIDIVAAVEQHIRKEGLEPAFPCTVSLNECAAHFTPTHNDARVLERGDLVKLDCGASLDGALSDNAVTIEVGDSDEHALMIEASVKCLEEAMGIIGPNVNLGDVGAAIELTAKDFGFKTIQNLTGHSLETYNLHAGLTVPNVGMRINKRPRIGDVLACEPFVTNGTKARVENSGPGNIYHFQRLAPQRLPSTKKLLNAVAKAHPKLPFAERWLTDAIEPKKLGFNLAQLQKQTLIKHYPALSEASGGMVSQTEATLIITEDGCVASTMQD